MADKIKIRKITSDNSINNTCRECKYWFECPSTNLIEDLYRSNSIWDLIKEKFIEKNIKSNGFKDFIKNKGIVIGAFKGRKNIGLAVAGRYYLFPKLKKFENYKPDTDSLFLSCIYLDPEYRKIGLGRKLFLYLAEYLSKNGHRAIETIGKRLTDDVYEEDYYNSPLIPFKFLIKNGFYIKENHEFFPILRIDLVNMVKDFSKESIDLSEFLRKRKLKNQVYIRK